MESILDPEIIEIICSFLDYDSLVSLSCCSKHMNEIAMKSDCFKNVKVVEHERDKYLNSVAFFNWDASQEKYVSMVVATIVLGDIRLFEKSIKHNKRDEYDREIMRNIIEYKRHEMFRRMEYPINYRSLIVSFIEGSEEFFYEHRTNMNKCIFDSLDCWFTPNWAKKVPLSF